LFCQECPKRPFCSNLCPEALAYSNQDQRPRREFFTLSEAKYSPLALDFDETPAPPFLSKTESKILMLLKKGFTREETCEILEISRNCLRSHLNRIRAKCDFPRLLDEGQKRV
jgi:DNA-binding NarL/FixJ family response regulator